MPVNRAAILDALRRTFEPLPFIHAMWEGGSASFNRVDEWSDIDVQFDVDDDHADEVIPLVEKTLESLSPIDLRYPITQSVWDLHAQVFYRLQNASPFLLVDVTVIKHSKPAKYSETEIHGHHVIYFDKSHVVSAAPINRADWNKQLAGRIEVLRVMFPLFQVLTLKEIHRGNSIEAFGFYQAYTLRPLIELLRISHSPFHYNFNTRHIHYDLPPDIVKRLEPLFYVTDVEDLERKRAQAEEWFQDLLSTH